MTFKGHEVRHVMIDGEPWFHATDVCKCLGLNLGGGTTQHTVKLGEDEKRRITQALLSQTPSGLLFLGGAGTAVAVSESGLYKLIMRSDKPEAREFQDWVTRVVLPAIRKTGGYLLNEEARPTALADQREQLPVPTNLAEALRAYADEVERRARAGAEFMPLFAGLCGPCGVVSSAKAFPIYSTTDNQISLDAANDLRISSISRKSTWHEIAGMSPDVGKPLEG